MYKQLFSGKDRKARIGLCMSGSGTNVERILDAWATDREGCMFDPVAVISDDNRSNGLKIKEAFQLPYYIGLDIRDFLANRGLERRLTLETQAHRDAREEYTEKLYKVLKPFGLDFLVFGGFEPLTNITRYYSCLNVHPGELTYLKDGRRFLVGLHTAPIQRAIDENIGYVRSTVIQAMPYSLDAKSDMDNGPILGLGPKLFYEDESDPKKIQDALKKASDWLVFPEVVTAAARGDIEVDYETLEVKNRVVMDSEYRISEVRGWK